MDPTQQLAAAIQGGEDILIYKRLTVAAFAVLYFDYLSTLSEEIRLFWKQRKAPISIVFFFNRYYPLFASVIILLMMFHPAFYISSSDACKRIALFLPIGWALPTWITAGLLLSARVYAFYSQNKKLGIAMLIYLAVTIVMTIIPYALDGAGPLPIPDIPLDPYHACIDLESPLIGRGSVTWVLLLCTFDTIIMCLVIFRVWRERKRYGLMSKTRTMTTAAGLVNILLRDGVVYFTSVFSFNFTFMMMVLIARPGRQYIMGIPAAVVSVVMANRVTINLREEVYQARRKSLVPVLELNEITSGGTATKKRGRLSMGQPPLLSNVNVNSSLKLEQEPDQLRVLQSPSDIASPVGRSDQAYDYAARAV